MTLVWVPSFVIFVLLIVSTPEQSSIKPTTTIKQSMNSNNLETSLTQSFSEKQKLDYTLIKKYIKGKYKKIKDHDISKISAYLVKFGKEMNIDPKITTALVARESSFNKKAISVTGAKGLGQIKNCMRMTLTLYSGVWKKTILEKKLQN